MQEAREEIAKLDELEDENFRIIKAINLEDSLNCVDKKQEKHYYINYMPSNIMTILQIHV